MDPYAPIVLETISVDHAEETLQQLHAVSSIPELCKDWTSKYRSFVVASQSVLTILYPHGARALSKLVSLLDTFCSLPPVP